MVWKSTRTRLLQHPLPFYQNLSALVNAHSNDEAIHYVERAVAIIFGGAHIGGGRSGTLESDEDEDSDSDEDS